MGQYHRVVNLSKFEFLDPHQLGVGLKACEQLHSHASTPHALFILTMSANGRGSGDLEDHPVVGHWAGDRIAVIGDYSGINDLPEEYAADTLWERLQEGSDPALVQLARAALDEDPHYDQQPENALYRDITPLVLDKMKQEFEFEVTDAEGWAKRKFKERV